jgi:hypothetical protein
MRTPHSGYILRQGVIFDNRGTSQELVMTSKFAGRFRQHAFRSPHCVSGTKMRFLPPKGPLSATNKYGNWRPWCLCCTRATSLIAKGRTGPIRDISSTIALEILRGQRGILRRKRRCIHSKQSQVAAWGMHGATRRPDRTLCSAHQTGRNQMAGPA